MQQTVSRIDGVSDARNGGQTAVSFGKTMMI
jgi:hypothetical protein